MDEFSKPYEYEEEKGVSGVLLIFFVMLIAFEPLIGIIAAFLGYGNVKSISIPENVFLVISLLFIVFPLVTAIIIRKAPKIAVKTTKVYLVLRSVYYIPFTILNSILMVSEIPSKIGTPEYQNDYSAIISGTVVTLVYFVAFSVVWYIYFNKSKKVRELFYGNNKAV